MQFTDLFMMQHELLLFALIITLLLMRLTGKESDTNHGALFAINILLFLNVAAGFFGSVSGELFGGMYRINPTLAMEKNLLNIGAFIVSLQSFDWMKRNKDALEFYIILLSTLLGMFFMLSSGHMLMFFIGLELSSLPLAALSSFNREDKRSAEAGLKMILMSGFSSCMLLLGISILYGVAGTLSFSQLPAALHTSDLASLAFIFLFSGFAFKISIVPFHLWTADVYEGSPVSVTSYLSVISKSAVSLIFITVLYKVFGQVSELWTNVLLITSILTMTVGNLFAMRQNNLKRFLAFSSIAQAAYILLGIMGNSADGMASVMYFILIYTFSNLAAFGVVSAIASATGKENISELRGLYRSNPRLSLLLLLAMFSLAGVPPTAGFFGKFFLLSAVAGQGHYALLAVASLNMVVSLYYYLRVVKAIFIDSAEEPLPRIVSSNYSRLGFVICAAGILATGFIGSLYEFLHSLSFGL